MSDNRRPVAFSADDMARRRKRAVVMAIGLAVLMVLFYVTTIVRMGGVGSGT
jgi:hypothetical protein